MISKETFIKNINKLQEFEKKCSNVDKALNALSPDFCGFFLPDVGDMIVEILSAAFNDKDEWIPYFAFEMDYLKNLKHGDVRDENGEIIDIKTWSDVYDFLIGNMGGTNNDNARYYRRDA